MFKISNTQYYIIYILSILIIIYCIFAYQYVFNQVDIIHHKIKMVETKPFLEFDENDFKQINIIKEWLLIKISNLFSIIDNLKKNILLFNENLHKFIYSIMYDFIIYI